MSTGLTYYMIFLREMVRKYLFIHQTLNISTNVKGMIRKRILDIFMPFLTLKIYQ